MTFLCLSWIALSHFLNTLYSNMDSISNLMASYHLLFYFQSQIAWPLCNFLGLGTQACKFGISQLV